MRTIEERRRILAIVVEGFAVGYDRILEVHGLRIPKHLAYPVGYWLGLDDDERKASAWMFGNGPLGIAVWLGEGRFDRPPELARRDGDPPQLLRVYGDTKHGRWGLWYDDPAELPRTVVRIEDDGETEPSEPTVLDSAWTAFGNRFSQNDPFEEAGYEAIIEWADEAHALELAAYKAERIPPHEERT